MKRTLFAKKSFAIAIIGTLVAVSPSALAVNPLQTWTLTSTTENWQAVACDSSCFTQYAGVYGGFLFKSIDGGVSWAQLSNSGSRNWNSLATSADGLYVTAVAFGGNIFRSSDSGSTWDSVGISANWRAISMTDSGEIQVAASIGGGIYISSNFGVTWNLEATPGDANWGAVEINDSGNVIVAGVKPGNIWTATRSNVTWTWSNRTGSGNSAVGSTGGALNTKGWSSFAISASGNRIVAVNDSANGGSGNLFFSADTGTAWTENNVGNYRWQSIAGSSDLLTIVMGSSNACGANCRLHLRTATTFGTWNASFVGTNSATAFQIAIAKNANRGIAPIFGGRLQFAGAVISQSTVTLNSSATSFRVNTTLTANISPSTGGRTTFFANGKRISGCISKLSIGSSVTCSYRPSVRGRVLIHARFVPTDINFTPSQSTTSTVLVSNRNSRR